MAIKKDSVTLLLGGVLLLSGLGILGYTFNLALAIATAPGDFLDSQYPQEPPRRGPSASFSWDSNDMEASVVDTSRPGDAPITSWDWNFGDGTRVPGQNPGPHPYGNASVYQVTLIVRDANGMEGRALAQVEAAPLQRRSGESMGDPTAGIVAVNFDLSGILRPVAFSTLTFGMYAVMALVGSAVTRAGWNLIKPKAETIRLRLKPTQLAQAIEEDPRSLMAYPPPPMQ